MKYLTMFLLLFTSGVNVLATTAILPEEQKTDLIFKPEMLNQFRTYDRNGPNYADIEKAFVAFTPSTPEQVDWCYLTCATYVRPELKMLAEKKLVALRDPALLAASRKHLFDDDKDVVKMALKTIVATNDQAALADLRKLEKMQTKAAKRVHYQVRQTRAKLHDPELLKELTDPKKQTSDSTLAMYNRELLKEYGAEGAKLLLNMEQNSQASKEQVDGYLSEIKDEKQVPDLLKRYSDTSLFSSKNNDTERKSAILKSLMRINSRECQSLFREILAKPGKELKIFESLEIQSIAMCVWRYNTRESEKLQDQYIADLKKEGGVIMYYWPQPKDKTSEIALVLAGKLNTSERGYLAAEALKRLTGQQFQYIPPSSSGDLREINIRSGKTPLTPEQIEAERQRDLKNLQIHLDRLGDDPRKASFEKSHRSLIKDQYDALLKSAQKPSEWEQGIPVSEAAQWLMNYYHIQPKENIDHEKK